jgi:3-oxoacyl-[acyl-carrier protein] reductase
MAARYDDLEGRRVLVTGASSGIGRGIAQAFLAQGARVGLHYHQNRAAALEVAALAPDRTVLVPGELSVLAAVRAIVDVTVRSLGGLDVVVHSAGVWSDGPIRTLEPDLLEETFRVNTFSAFWLAREAARVMEGKGGTLIFLGSTAGQRGEPGHAHYAASKAAVRALVQSIAQELGPGIRSNLISPGWVRTPMVEQTLAASTAERIASFIPDRRLGTVDDCANAALFLASSASSHLTGTELEVSGGALLPVPSRV